MPPMGPWEILQLIAVLVSGLDSTINIAIVISTWLAAHNANVLDLLNFLLSGGKPF